jgi:hypothetical protein
MVIVFRGGCFKSLVGAHLWSAIIGGGCYDAVDRGAQPRSYLNSITMLGLRAIFLLGTFPIFPTAD